MAASSQIRHSAGAAASMGGKYAPMGRTTQTGSLAVESDDSFSDGITVFRRSDELDGRFESTVRFGSSHSYDLAVVQQDDQAEANPEEAHSWQLTHHGTGLNTGGVCDTRESAAQTATATAERWSDLQQGFNVEDGSRTPWGPADGVEPIAPGIVSVSTAGHGGVRISAERLKEVDARWRASRSTWFEEDCDWAIVAYSHPEAFSEVHREAADQLLRDYRPDQYEAITGQEIGPGKSYQRAQDLFRKQHANDWVSTGMDRSPDHPGMVIIRARLGRVGQDAREFLVPEAEYTPGMIVDPDRHQDVTPPPPGPPARHLIPGVGKFYDTSKVTDGERTRAEAFLAKRIRDVTGQVMTNREYFEKNPIRSVHQSFNAGGGLSWYADIAGDDYVTGIPAALAKAAIVPDETSEGTRRAKVRLAEERKKERAFDAWRQRGRF